MQYFDGQYKQSPLQFSTSKMFFQNQDELLQKIGFFASTSIDTYFKYTFQLVETKYFIQGGEFEGINVSHEKNEEGIIYKIGFANPKFKNVEFLSVNLLDSSQVVDSSIQSILKSFPFIEWGIFLFFLLMIPFVKGLFWINVIGAGILLLFTIWKFVKSLCKEIFKTKKTYTSGLATNYQDLSDTLFLTPEVVETIKTLKEFQISNFCYTGNCMYLLQSLKKDIFLEKGLVKKIINRNAVYTEQEKADLQQRTLSYIQQPEFLSKFI